MTELLENELRRVCEITNNLLSVDIKEETAFELLMCSLFCIKDFEYTNSIPIARDCSTNGKDDGGIDFIYFDDENYKVILSQCKLVERFSPNDLITELNKMSTTLENFKSKNTGMYNQKLKEVLQNALDSLPDENEFNVEYQVFVSCNLNLETYYNKIGNEQNSYTKDMVSIFSENEIASKIEDYISDINTVNEFKIKIDKAKNILSYNAVNQEGIMVNLSSHSLTTMYNKFKNDGLFDLNIRKYISNKQVDSGIKRTRTLDKERENFWFLNNGIIIACKDYVIDGDQINLFDFSIVNGGQTTNRIGEYKGNNSEEFYIPCKIISNNKEDDRRFYNKIAEASNSQKPIYPRDLKSNAYEMQQLKHWLSNYQINLEIKRGEKRKNNFTKIRNDELGQLILAFIHQQPGTARSGKRNIFDNDTLYNKVYKVNYEKDIDKKTCILDLIKLYVDYCDIEKKLRITDSLSNEEKIVLANGKFVIFAIIGLLYRFVNNDILIDNLIDLDSRKNIDGKCFEYKSFVSNYKDDDYNSRLEALIVQIVQILNMSYEQNKIQSNISSVSNYFKTDAKYRELIIKSVADNLRGKFSSIELLEGSKILIRNDIR